MGSEMCIRDRYSGLCFSLLMFSSTNASTSESISCSVIQWDKDGRHFAQLLEMETSGLINLRCGKKDPPAIISFQVLLVSAAHLILDMTEYEDCGRVVGAVSKKNVLREKETDMKMRNEVNSRCHILNRKCEFINS